MTHITVPPTRFDRLDALRGTAIVWMMAFHFCFDLNHFHFITQKFSSNPVWTLQRTCIVALFVFCAGMGQSVAWRAGQGWPRFWRRWAHVVACALFVSAASYFMFPKSFITFGVLHGMAVMLIVARLTGRASVPILCACGFLALLLPHFFSHSFFDTRVTNWVGLITHKPRAEDYVPIFPWLGVMWLGVAACQWLQTHRLVWLQGHVPHRLHFLCFLGRWPLTIYMVHQPLFMGFLGLLAWWSSTGNT
jgi:uncharacterized membrane protein